MQVTSIEYTRKISERPELGVMKYESMELTMSGVLEEGESAEFATGSLRYLVDDGLGLKTKAPEQSVKGTPADSVPHGGNSAKDSKKVDDSSKKKAAAEKKAAAAAKKKEDASKKKAEKEAAKQVPYDRENKAHRDEFASILTDRFPDWKKAPTKAKELSVALNGKPIFDSKGEILGSFTDAVVEGMGATGEDDL